MHTPETRTDKAIEVGFRGGALSTLAFAISSLFFGYVPMPLVWGVVASVTVMIGCLIAEGIRMQ